MDTHEMNTLVEIIARQVKARLGDVTSSSSGESYSTGPCSGEHPGSCSLPGGACGSCGFNPVNTKGEWLPPAKLPTPAEMARFIDHTLLKANAERSDIEELCGEARKYQFFSVCVNSGNVRLARIFLERTNVKVCAVVGFPLGASTPGAKAFEAREAIRCGADEIDMVLNIGALRSRDYALVLDDIRKVVQAANGKLVKVILETGMLETMDKVIACALSKVGGASFVKTSTGFGPGGATESDIALMRSVVGPDLGVKASGGVRTYADAVKMMQAGANRLGCSSSVAVVTGGTGGSGY